jgi:hypothetical protein
MSIPVTWPVFADHLRGDERVGPAPEPRSSTRSPGAIRPSCHGLATPANEPTAVSGTFASSAG